MIVRVWGIVNSTEVEFTPVPDHPGYWEGYAPKIPGLQDIEIWAENDKGACGHLQCTVQVHYHVHAMARLVLLPYMAKLLQLHDVRVVKKSYNAKLAGIGGT